MESQSLRLLGLQLKHEVLRETVEVAPNALLRLPVERADHRARRPVPPGRCLFRYRPMAIDQPFVPGAGCPTGVVCVSSIYRATRRAIAVPSAIGTVSFSRVISSPITGSAPTTPPFLNSCPEDFPASLRKVKELSPRSIIPNHYDRFDGEWHRRKFDQLTKRRSAI